MDINSIISKYKSLNLHEVIDHDRFNQYAIVHHSTAIEGSTLTENETRLLLEEGVTPKGKPLEHSLMVKDHFGALQFTLRAAEEKQALTVELIQSINATVMKSTGNIESYTRALIEKINQSIHKATSQELQLELAFSSHFDLVSIHPFYDGNGRTSRLLMNFIQHNFQLPLAIVFKEDKADYFQALQLARKAEDISIFNDFMLQQYAKHLQQEITLFTDMKMGKNLKRNNNNRSRFSLFY
jgi:Fic family protein